MSEPVQVAALPAVPDLGFRATLAAAIRYRAAQSPDREFIVSLDRRMTFAEIERASAQLARRLLGAGVGKGTRLGLYFSYGPDWVVAWLAASRVGAVVIPLSTIYTPRELGRVLRFSDCQLVITGAQVARKDVASVLTEALDGLGSAPSADLRLRGAPYLRSVWMAGAPTPGWARPVDLYAATDGSEPDEDLLAAVESEVVPSDLGVVVYTSGSSADPKGVVHTQGSMLRNSVTFVETMRRFAGDRPPKLVCGMPFFWVGGLLTLAGALLGPMTLLVMERFDTGQALELVERESGTYVMGWPTLIQRLRAHPDFARRDLSSAPVLTEGPADSASLDLPMPGVPVHRGMSETMGTFDGVEAKVVAPESGRLVEPGAEGELCVRGTGIMDGYYKAERFDTFDADGWFHTGDRVVRLVGDPRIFFRGRDTELIKVSGANVAPREVELALEDLAEVLHAVVLGVPSADRGEEVLAVVVPSPHAFFDTKSAAAYLRTQLSAYKVPTLWVVAKRDELPWLGSEKPDKRAIRVLVEQGRLT